MSTQYELTTDMDTLSLCSNEFDYGDIPSIDVKALESHAKRIRDAAHKSQRTLLRYVLQVGEELVSAQQRLANHGNGTFARWCLDACGLKKTMAYKLIDAFHFAKDRSLGERSFDVSALYVLGASNCPEDARTQAIELAEQGEYITGRLAKELVEEHTPAPPECDDDTFQPEIPSAHPVLVPAPTEVARRKLEELVREFQEMQIGATEIADLLRAEAERLLATQKGEEPIEVEAKAVPPRKRRRQESRGDADHDNLQTLPCFEEEDEPPISKKKSREEIAAIAKRAAAIAAENKYAKCSDPAKNYPTIHYKDTKYYGTVVGTSALQRIADAENSSWSEATGDLEQMIREAWESFVEMNEA